MPSVSHGISELVSSGPLLLAAPLALLAGAVSFFSPCCLPLVPGYVSYATGMSAADVQAGRESRGRMVAGTALFILGFSALFASYGAALGYVGNTLFEYQDLITRILGALTILLGLLFLDAFERIPFAGRTFRISYHPRVGLAGAPLLGVMFGLGWTPCIGPTLAAVMSLSFTTGSAGRGALLAFIYGVGRLDQLLCLHTYLKDRSRRLLVTTKTEEKAIAAPAIIGLSIPKAASGRAATL
jgi:cytochrome c-type biogenesis protein